MSHQECRVAYVDVNAHFLLQEGGRRGQGSLGSEAQEAMLPGNSKVPSSLRRKELPARALRRALLSDLRRTRFGGGAPGCACHLQQCLLQTFSSKNLDNVFQESREAIWFLPQPPGVQGTGAACVCPVRSYFPPSEQGAQCPHARLHFRLSPSVWWARDCRFLVLVHGCPRTPTYY